MQQQDQKQKFGLKFIPPFSTFQDGAPKRIPFVIDGLLTQGGFSALGAKPKHGKSSLSRHEAVCVAKGTPFLGRTTVQGEVILISLEDPRCHVDNCLKVLGYDPSADAAIHIVEGLPPTLDQTIEVLGEELGKRHGVRLVIVDTLAKLLRVGDLNDYMETLKAVEALHGLARRYPQLHIQGLAHCKKVKTDDPFDSLLGSVALRGEPDTNVALYQENGQRVIVSETRMGKPIPATILGAEVVESAGCDVVKDFYLAEAFDEWSAAKADKAEGKRKLGYEDRVIGCLSDHENFSATQEQLVKEVRGKRQSVLDAIERLSGAGVVTFSGTKQSPTDPLKLTLNPQMLSLYRLGGPGIGKQ